LGSSQPHLQSAPFPGLFLPTLPLSTPTYTGTSLLDYPLPSQPPGSNQNLTFWLRVRGYGQAVRVCPLSNPLKHPLASYLPRSIENSRFCLSVGVRLTRKPGPLCLCLLCLVDSNLLSCPCRLLRSIVESGTTTAPASSSCQCAASDVIQSSTCSVPSFDSASQVNSCIASLVNPSG
jgi:hypothetical protein